METTPICYISGALPLSKTLKLHPGEGDLIIAADGGYPQLAAMNITPNIIVGDFDSAPEPSLLNLNLKNLENLKIIKLPIEKDDTDMGYALKLGLEQNFKNFVLLGGLGGLLDHTMANLQHLLSLSQQNCRGILIGDGQCATVITNTSLTLAGGEGCRCSIFAWGGEASGVTLKNLYYPLENATLSPSFPLGVSNAFLSAPQPAEISVSQGSLLIIWTTGQNNITQQDILKFLN